MAGIQDVSARDHRNRFRVGKCGKYERSPESVERQRQKQKAFWADPANKERQSRLTRARMAQPGVSEKISTRTSAALADPETKQRQKAGLTRAWADPAKREMQAELTRDRMAKWRAKRRWLAMNGGVTP